MVKSGFKLVIGSWKIVATCDPLIIDHSLLFFNFAKLIELPRITPSFLNLVTIGVLIVKADFKDL